MESQIIENFDRNLTADTAWACTVYSMVPYLGILFVPLALAVSGFDLFRARQRALPNRRRTLFSIGMSLVILVIQIFLWWLLYFIPTLGRV